MPIKNEKIKHQTASAGVSAPALQKPKIQTASAKGGTPARHKRKHLRRLEQIFERHRAPLYYMTICVENRSPVLATQPTHDILFNAWKDAKVVHGWLVGRYVVMPDHVHFFCSPQAENKKDLSEFIGDWKNWTQLQINKPRLFYFDWQEEFFDHLLRSPESYNEKWDYVRNNPVREKLVAKPEDWPYQGEIYQLEW